MKFLILSLFIFAGCAQKNINVNSVTEVESYDGSSFFKECSQIRAASQDIWLLTCQRPPHKNRTEIYEWNNSTHKYKRLTYQDGQIWDIAPINQNDFFYSSSYDEFKEQFASILQGAESGSDIYLKNRHSSEFKRVTDEKGLEISFFWEPQTQLLYFVHENGIESQVMTLNRRLKQNSLYSVKKKSIRNPTVMEKSRNLYWLEYDSSVKGATLRSLSRSKKVNDIYQFNSRVFQLSPYLKPEQLMLGFSTEKGTQIWNLNLIDGCWRLAYKTEEPVSEFYVMNEEWLFLTVKNSIRRNSMLKFTDTCLPIPPDLGRIIL
jgi:hypothetical protein